MSNRDDGVCADKLTAPGLRRRPDSSSRHRPTVHFRPPGRVVGSLGSPVQPGPLTTCETAWNACSRTLYRLPGPDGRGGFFMPRYGRLSRSPARYTEGDTASGYHQEDRIQDLRRRHRRGGPEGAEKAAQARTELAELRDNVARWRDEHAEAAQRVQWIRGNFHRGKEVVDSASFAEALANEERLKLLSGHGQDLDAWSGEDRRVRIAEKSLPRPRRSWLQPSPQPLGAPCRAPRSCPPSASLRAVRPSLTFPWPSFRRARRRTTAPAVRRWTESVRSCPA